MKLLVKLFGKNFFTEGSPYQKKVDYINYYPILVICKNCNKSTQIYIKKGVHVNDIITSVKCSNCEVRLEKEKL